MKKSLLVFVIFVTSLVSVAQQTRERLNRAPIAIKVSNGMLLSWRSLIDDNAAMGFNIYRDGVKVNRKLITTKTNYRDANGLVSSSYRIDAVIKNKVVDSFVPDVLPDNIKRVVVNRPPATPDASGTMIGKYRPDDASVGDVDGDGEYEIVLKWLPNNQRDSGKEGVASPTYIDCYKMDGKQLWRVCLGHNIRSGNHTMQFLVYDFDGDGKAEMICRTAPGAKDGKGNFVTDAATDTALRSIDNSKTYQNSKGFVTEGGEFLTVFNGITGKAMHTIWYRPNRGFGDSGEASLSTAWGDGYSGRAERMNAAVAYLDGLDKLPSAVMQRGYYTQCYIWAVDWNGTSLTTKWLHRGTSASAWDVIDGKGKVIDSGNGKSSFGQGNHGISVGDIDGDGCDDICIGSASISSKGKLLCSTGLGHGDALHLADLCPDRPGLEVMMPHEQRPYGYDVHDALTGEILAYGTSGGDNGRGLAADVNPNNRGYEFWSSADGNMYDCATGNVVASVKGDVNFRIYWDGDLYDETFDGRYISSQRKASPRIQKFDGSGFSELVNFASYESRPQTCNSTKATPCLQADLLGDWREELIMWENEDDYSSSTVTLDIITTNYESDYKVPCLMQDHVYRMGVAWQNSSYNQPPHLGFYLPDLFKSKTR